MLEDHLRSAHIRQRIDEGPAAPYADAFADWLSDQGYPSRSVELKLRSLATWSDWLRGKSFGSGALVDGYEAYRRALEVGGHLRHKHAGSRRSLAVAAQLIRFLREQGVLAAAQKPLPPSAVWPILEVFHSWIVQHRGMAPRSTAQYESVAAEFVAAVGADPGTYSALAIRSFVLERARGHATHTAQSMASMVRAYLRFLAVTGQCSDEMLSAVPRFANWRLSSTPRFLEPQELERLIGSCSDDSAWGLRSRAVILLLSRLGLRAGDVTELTFDDIDWKNGRIAVCGKARRRQWLPLPQQVGDAILEYLRRARAPLSVAQIFTSVRAPHGAMSRAAVSQVVRAALRRTGIKAPVSGAHLLRHSAATAMLRGGASLAAVGAVLRHRSPSTTALYVKVDFALLSEIAQPWPEVPHVDG